jgi:hypothetical protein
MSAAVEVRFTCDDGESPTCVRAVTVHRPLRMMRRDDGDARSVWAEVPDGWLDDGEHNCPSCVAWRKVGLR